jgi:hypothetical protein
MIEAALALTARRKSSATRIEVVLSASSVHLGSAVVHRQPGGLVCIVLVYTQHRGWIFLPFTVDDPRTAEVISKVLLLARDKGIKDPTILEQILPSHLDWKNETKFTSFPELERMESNSFLYRL